MIRRAWQTRWWQPSRSVRNRNLIQGDRAAVEVASRRRAPRSSGWTRRTTSDNDMEASGNSAAKAGAPPSHSSSRSWGEYMHRPRLAASAARRNGINRPPRSFPASNECTHTSGSPPTGSFTGRASTRQTTDAAPGPGNSSTRIATVFVVAAWATRLATAVSWLTGNRSPKPRPTHCSSDLPSVLAIAALRLRIAPSKVKRAEGAALRRSSSEASICGSLTHAKQPLQ